MTNRGRGMLQRTSYTPIYPLCTLTIYVKHKHLNSKIIPMLVNYSPLVHTNFQVETTAIKYKHLVWENKIHLLNNSPSYIPIFNMGKKIFFSRILINMHGLHLYIRKNPPNKKKAIKNFQE